MPAAARPIIHPRKRQETQKKGTEDRIEPGQRVTCDNFQPEREDALLVILTCPEATRSLTCAALGPRS